MVLATPSPTRREILSYNWIRSSMLHDDHPLMVRNAVPNRFSWVRQDRIVQLSNAGCCGRPTYIGAGVI